MSDLIIGGPETAALQFAQAVVTGIFDLAKTVRETQSQPARDEDDRIRQQAYWDYRAILEKFGIVGPPGAPK